MRLEERCPCGGEIVVVYDPDSRSYTRGSEQSEAHKQIDNWRRRHRECLKRLGEVKETADA